MPSQRCFASGETPQTPPTLDIGSFAPARSCVTSSARCIPIVRLGRQTDSLYRREPPGRSERVPFTHPAAGRRRRVDAKTYKIKENKKR